MRYFEGSVSIVLFLIFLICLGLSAQTPAQGTISVQAGILTFPNPKNGPEVYVEFPFVVNRNQFSFRSSDSANSFYEGSVYAEVIIYDTLDNHVDSASTFFGMRVKDPRDTLKSDIRLFDKLYVMLPAGSYKGRLNVVDVASKREGSFLFDRISIPAIVYDTLSLSSLELAYDIKVIEDSIVASRSRLCKNGRDVIPNPMGIFAQKDTMLCVYAELYNLSFDSSSPGEFSVDYKLYEDNGALRLDYGGMLVPKPGRTSIITSSLKIGNIGSGRYILTMIASDPATGKTATVSRRFIIIPPSGYRPSAPLVSRENPLDTASLATMSNIVRYLTTPQELALFNNLNDSGKTRFIQQFFRDKDPTPGTEANEYRDDAFRRYNYANENFSTLPGLNDGWKTDRGRVLMQYGQWDERDEETSPSYEKPWERWYFRAIQGGVLFIFVDREGFGDYKLVHSTANGEIFNSEWNQRVKDENLQTY